MKLSGRAVLFLAAVLAIAASVIFVIRKPVASDQASVKKTLGVPDQFVITYLPRGERELVRTEVWLYQEAGKRLGFSEGKLVYAEDYEPDETVAATSLEPQDFHYDLTLAQISDAVGGEVEEGEILPDFETTKVYYSPKAIFVTDNGYLTYFQTIGAGDKSYLSIWEETENSKDGTPDAGPAPTGSTSSTPDGWKSYTSSDIGISLSYPPDWFLTGGVLSSYNPDTVESTWEFPAKSLKCDFHPYDSKTLGIGNPQQFFDGSVTVAKGTAIDLSGEDGPGLGDGVLYIISDKNGKQMALTCYAYNAEFEDILKQLFGSFMFL